MAFKFKNKTAAIPHRIMNQTSIYLAKQSKVEREDYLGYEAIVELANNKTITIQSSSLISPKDGKAFEYILAQWQASKKDNVDLKNIVVDIEELLTVMGYINRTETRRKIIQNLKNLMNITIIYSEKANEVIFHMLEDIRIIDGTKTISLKVSNSYQEAILSAGERYINVSDTMPLKGKYSLELARYLKINGGGITHKVSKLRQEIKHTDICEFLHLDHTTKKSKDIISRAFRELKKKANYPVYNYITNTGSWRIMKN